MAWGGIVMPKNLKINKMKKKNVLMSVAQAVKNDHLKFNDFNQISFWLESVFDTEEIDQINGVIKLLQPAKHLVEAWLKVQMESIGYVWQPNTRSMLIRKVQLELFDHQIGEINQGNLHYSEYFWSTVRDTEFVTLIEYFLKSHSKVYIDADEIADLICEFIDFNYNNDEEQGPAFDLGLISSSFIESKSN